jgi:hypothetical protein
MIARRKQLQHLGALHAQALARQHRSLSQQGIEIIGTEGFDAEFGKCRFLLLHTLDKHALAGCCTTRPFGAIQLILHDEPHPLIGGLPPTSKYRSSSVDQQAARRKDS